MPASILPFPTPMPGPDPTVREIVGLYLSLELEAKTSTRPAKHAWEERERILRKFQDQFGDLKLSECRKGHLRIWIEQNPALKSDWTRGRWCRTVQRVFNWACDGLDAISKNPFKGVRYPKGKRGRPLTDAEFAQLLAAAGKEFQAVLRFCRLTGARPGEMAAAKWSDLEVDTETGRGVIILQEHKTSHVEDAPPRVIGLGREVIELLDQVRRALGVFPGFEPDHIFLNSRRKPWTRNAIALRMGKLRKQCGLPADAKLYGLRHAFATRALERGVALKDTSELLGHTTTRMTEYYVHLTQKRRNRLSGLADRATGEEPAAD